MKIVNDIQQIVRQAQQTAYRSINRAMVQAYWLVGKRIVEEEQQGEAKAAYGKGVIKSLSAALQAEFGKGFSERNLENMRAFYLQRPIPQTASAEFQVPEFQLSWSHYQLLMRIHNIEERAFYEIETLQNNWSLRELIAATKPCYQVKKNCVQYYWRIYTKIKSVLSVLFSRFSRICKRIIV